MSTGFLGWVKRLFGGEPLEVRRFSTEPMARFVDTPAPTPLAGPPRHRQIGPAHRAPEVSASTWPAKAAPGTPMVRNPGPSTQPWPAVVLQGRAGLERCIAIGDWDTARATLQKLAYCMADAPPEQKDAFTQIASGYAARDPLVQKVLDVLLPQVAREPGIKQTATYALFPAVDTEWLRYALYYADVLGLVQRRKKGNTYTLWPAGTPQPAAQLPPAKTTRRRTPAGPRFTPEDRAMRREHWATRMPQLLANTDRRPYWQFRTTDDGRDPPACQAKHMRIERFDSDFWRENNPAKCRRANCRCSIRAYTAAEVADLLPSEH